MGVTALQKERTERARRAKEKMVKVRAKARKARLRLSPLQRALVLWWSQQARSNLLIPTTMTHHQKRKPRLLLVALMRLSKLFALAHAEMIFTPWILAKFPLKDSRKVIHACLSTLGSVVGRPGDGVSLSRYVALWHQSLHQELYH